MDPAPTSGFGDGCRGSEAAYADAKAAAKAPTVKKAPARPPVDAAPAKAVSPAPSTVTQPAPEPMGHLDAPAGGQSAVFGKSPPPATWREVGFQTREHAEMHGGVHELRVGPGVLCSHGAGRAAGGASAAAAPAPSAGTGRVVLRRPGWPSGWLPGGGGRQGGRRPANA